MKHNVGMTLLAFILFVWQSLTVFVHSPVTGVVVVNVRSSEVQACYPLLEADLSLKAVTLDVCNHYLVGTSPHFFAYSK
jgi:hypothetical protein